MRYRWSSNRLDLIPNLCYNIYIERKKKIYMDTDYKLDLRNYLENYDEYSFIYEDFNENFIENLIEIRKNMREKVELPPLPILDYKRNTWRELNLLHNFEGLDVSDEILLSNRLPSGEKLTKRISKAIYKDDYRYSTTDPRIDYFNKPRNEKNTYIISADPLDILRLYYEVETCISPWGSNQSTIYRYLYSDQIYIAYSSDERSRLIIFDNPEQKIVFLCLVYGYQDPMLVQTVIQHYIDLGYSFLDTYYFLFDTRNWFYCDGTHARYLNLIRVMGGTIVSGKDIEEENRVAINRVPAHWDKDEDALFKGRIYDKDNIIYPFFKDSGNHTIYEGQEFCDNCGEVIDDRDYDYDYEMCAYCANGQRAEDYKECEGCGNPTFYEELSEDGLCSACQADVEYFICDACGQRVPDYEFNEEAYLCIECDKGE